MSMIDVICDYSNKNLQSLPSTILDMYNLKMLYLESNSIEWLPDDIFSRLTKLTWLDLRNNKLISVPISIAHHPCLETLLLQDNNIEELPNEIGVVPNLKVLQLSGNPLKYPIPDIVNDGVQSVRDFLKQEFLKTSKISLTEEDEKEISVIERTSTSAVTNRSGSKTSAQQLLRRSVLKRRVYDQLLPVINVKGLSKSNSKEDNDQPKDNTCNAIVAYAPKRSHKITRKCSKISVRSQSQWNSKRKPGDVEIAQNNELKDIWLNRLKELLTDQEKILQQEKNLRALSKWRVDKKIEPVRQPPAKVAEAPFGTDPDCFRILSRKDITSQIDKMIRRSKKSTKRTDSARKADVEKLIKEVVDQMKNLESKYEQSSSPRKEQEVAAKQIESIVELHRRIVALQASNSSL